MIRTHAGHAHSTLRRFRTYYPDAYKKHYPNARTHLSSKVRSVLPDGSSLFVKTRGKRRRPFSEEEDRALKAGYEKHGTTWATIVKDPIFREQNRRSTDLRDRFRNAFPNLYQAAGYKPRSNKKKLDGPVRAATDDQLSMSTSAIGPSRPNRRRAQTSQGLLRGGIKSVPQSTACSEAEDSSGAEDEAEAESVYVFKTSPTPIFVDTVSTLSFRSKKAATKDVCILDNDNDEEMAPLYPLTDPLNIPDFLPSETHSDMETWSSGINTPTHSSHAWSTAAVSPASSSNVSDYLMNSSSQSSPFLQRPLSECLGGNNNNNMIGKSAWGAHDWFSSNPRLDNSAGTASSSNSSTSFFGEGFSSPASPYSFHPHGVVDRYDLFPSSIPGHMSSEMGLGDSAGAGAAYFGFGSEEMTNGFKGYHSQIAGDLISGARTHQQSSSGFYGFGDLSGLGLSGVSHHHQQQQQQASIHPMQLHTPLLLGIDELGLTDITLNDQVDPVVSSTSMDDRRADSAFDLGVFDLTRSPAGLQEQQNQQQEQQKSESSSMLSDRFNLDDLVDMSGELHATPPATPLIQPRPLRRSSGSILHHYGDIVHARSTSVPPAEARNGTEHSLSSSSGEIHNHLVHPFFGHTQSHPHTPTRSSTSHPRQRTSEPMRLSNSTGSIPMQSSSTNLFSDHLMLVSPSSSSSGTSTNNGIGDMWRSVPVGTDDILAGDNHNDNKNGKANGQNLPSPSLSSFMSNTISPGDFYNLPFLDLHYYGHTHGSGTSMSLLGGHTPTMGSGMDLSHGGMGTATEMARQGQALDLAQSAVLASGSKNGSGPLRQSSQHQPVLTTNTKQAQRAPPNILTPLLPSAALTSPHSRTPSPHLSPRTPQPGPSLVLAPNGMGTIRQSHVTNHNNSLGRSMSHHRGLSAVCPQDLVLRNDNNKRKRASWDGGAP